MVLGIVCLLIALCGGTLTLRMVHRGESGWALLCLVVSVALVWCGSALMDWPFGGSAGGVGFLAAAGYLTTVKQ